jgi:hypothetical protein
MANAALQAQGGRDTIGVCARTSTGDLIPHRDHLSRAARRGAAANLIQALASVVGHVDEHGETDRQNASNSLILVSEG